jgi:NadR type nicotinamide-nucleotide adenylyltransferase
MAPIAHRPLLTVVVTGSECTGKTTLAVDLAKHYGTAWSPEFARAYHARKGGTLDESDVEPIALGQIGSEDAASPAATRLLVKDTDLLSTVAYARHYYGGCPRWVERTARERRGDLYLLLHPDVPWLPDPQRDRPHRRDEIHALFRAVLDAFGARVVDVRGTWAERGALSRQAIDALLATAR